VSVGRGISVLLPEVGDRVCFEGSTWRVSSTALPSLQRVDGDVVTVAEASVMLISETSPSVGAAVHEMKVAESRCDEIRVLES
jgi:hypothetical protein